MIATMLTSPSRSRPMFLASVVSPAEALLALQAGADIIDCKDPSQGALGALSPDRIRGVVEAVGERASVSATIGDLAGAPCNIRRAVEATARTGVDFVKVGFFGDGDARPLIAELGRAENGRAQLVAVLMADRSPDFALLPNLAAVGFAAVMLDTADKHAGALPDVMERSRLAHFVDCAHKNQLLVGLAGSLRLENIRDLVHLDPDILGFRGALCLGGRTGAVDAARAAGVARAISETARADRAATV
ncbi:MAG: (5-formylfuran-3-yl)methyl phosphate synthase [Hyphomicrobium sp.]